MKLKIISLIILLVSSLWANELQLQFLVGTSSLLQKGPHRTYGKLISANYNLPLERIIAISFGGGLMVEDNFFGSKSHPYLEVTPLLSVRNSVFYAKVGQGFMYQPLTKQTNLTTRHQFATYLGVGINSKEGSVGVAYRHFSNGRSSNNKGSDYIGLEGNLRW